MTGPRVVIIANNVDEVGGAQRVVHVLAQGLAGRGYDVDLVGITPFAPRHEFFAEPRYRTRALMSRQWPAPPKDSSLTTRLRPSVRRLIATRARLRDEAVRGLGRVLADGTPGIVISAQVWAMEHLADVPHRQWAVIGQYHSSFEAAADGRDLARVLRYYADADVFAALTPDDADAFRRAGLNNTTWLPNPLAFWPADVSPIDKATGSGFVTYVGRFSSEKGVRFLVEAWGRVAHDFPHWQLRLVGSGPQDADVRRWIAALPAGRSQVVLLPPVEDVEPILRSSEIVVLPSLTEGLPLVLAEAMAAGRACVATDCSAGVRLLSDDGAAAELVPRGDATALAASLAALMEDGARRAELGARARSAVEPYRISPVLDRWEALFAQVLR